MLRKLILSAMLLWSTASFGQWQYDQVVDATTGAYKIAFVKDTEFPKAFLKMEMYEGNLVLYLQDTYICGQEVYVSAIFVTPLYKKEVVFFGRVSENGEVMFLEKNLKAAFFRDLFKQSTEVVLKLTTQECADTYYQFLMSGSSAAYNFMVK
jgi:hypothetical protein